MWWPRLPPSSARTAWRSPRTTTVTATAITKPCSGNSVKYLIRSRKSREATFRGLSLQKEPSIMSSVFKALQQFEVERRGIAAVGNEPLRPLDLITESVEPDDSAPTQFVSLQPTLTLENRIGGMLGDNS